MDENGEPEFPQWLQTTHLQHGFLWDMGGLQQEANAPVGFQCFYREGWSQQFPQEGQEVFSYTLCIATPHSPLHWSIWFMLTSWKFPPQLQPAGHVWMSYLLIEAIQYFLPFITWHFPWYPLLYFLLLGRFLFKIKADANLTGKKPNEFIKSQASCWTDSRAIQLLQSEPLPAHCKDQQVTLHHFWQASVLRKNLAPGALQSYYAKCRTSQRVKYDKFRVSTAGGC